MIQIIRLFDLMLVSPRKDFLGALIGGAIGLAGSMYSGKKNREAAASAQQSQIDFEKYKMANYHQYQVEDLRKAGLNPILSASGNTPVGSPAGAFGTQDNPGTAAANSAMAVQQMRLQARQQKNQDLIAESQVDLNSARAEKERADAQYRHQEIAGDYAGAKIRQLTSSAQHSEAAAQNLVKQGAILEKDLVKTLEEIKNLQAERENINASRRWRDSAAALDRVRALESASEARLKDQLTEYHAISTSLNKLDFNFRSTDYGRRYGRSWQEFFSGNAQVIHQLPSEIQSAIRDAASLSRNVVLSSYNYVNRPPSATGTRRLREGSDK